MQNVQSQSGYLVAASWRCIACRYPYGIAYVACVVSIVMSPRHQPTNNSRSYSCEAGHCMCGLRGLYSHPPKKLHAYEDGPVGSERCVCALLASAFSTVKARYSQETPTWRATRACKKRLLGTFCPWQRISGWTLLLTWEPLQVTRGILQELVEMLIRYEVDPCT